MSDPKDPNNSGLAVNDEIHGYRIQKILYLKEIDATMYLLNHLATGARHMHISSRDQENTFGVTFKTVPTDSTGVAHILEHTVLCGSEKYPVRDPFFSMLKRSLSTFMNAFTASDWTMYPYATQNGKDFYNLMDVYLDAAFFPKLNELSFKQEGHRLELEKKENGDVELVYKGVVYNEMKGAMSSPDQVMARSMLNALYPDTTYSHNSGGEPAVIPQLSYNQLKAFHQRHYHPSNSFFYTYGNLPLTGHLERIDQKVMQRFQRIDPQIDVPPQPRWQEPKQVRYTYPLSPGEDPTRKCQVSLAWLTCDTRDTFEVLVLTVLEQILLGNAASPLRKALIDSGLGSAVSDASGYDAENRDTLFACGLKDVDENSAQPIEEIIFNILEKLVREKIDPELIDTAIHQIEFHRKEITNTPYPHGIKLLLRVIGSWLHGGDPERILQLDADFARLHDEIAKGPFLEKRIEHYFLNNQHRVRMVLAPDQKKGELEEERIKAELQARLEQLSKQQCIQIEKDAEKLSLLQESQEDISCLPTLALDDIPPEVQGCAPTRIEPQDALWCYTQPTAGIFYYKGAAGAAAIPPELRPWVPFFCYAFSKIGTQKVDYVTMARRIDAVTGGLALSARSRALSGRPDTCLPLITLDSKCLMRNVGSTIEIIDELLAGVDFSDFERLKQLLGEYRAGLESMIVHNGHRLALSLSSRKFRPASALDEMWGGVQQIQTIRSLKDATPVQLQDLSENLNRIAKAVFTPDNYMMAVIGEAEPVENAVSAIRSSSMLSGFKSQQNQPKLPLLDLSLDPAVPYEGWSTSTAVSFVAQTMPTAAFGHEDAPALSVLSKLLRSLYLHREIREKGGAYGGFALYNTESGLFSLASYRDPHINRTLDVYRRVYDFLNQGHISDEDIKEAVLQVCSEIDRPDPPGPLARKAFTRLLVELDDPDRLAFKQQLLKLTKDRILETAGRYFRQDNDRVGVAIISGRDQLEQANSQLTERTLEIKPI